MAASLEQLEARIRQAARDVLAVAAGREHVQLALPEPCLGLDLLQVEAPGLGEGEVVVGPAADALPHGLHERLLHERAVLRAGDEPTVDLGQLGRDLVDHDVRVAEQLVPIDLEVRLDRFAPLERGAELLDVDVGEVGEEVEVGRVGRRRRDQGADTHDAISQERTAGERMGCAAGAADDREALEAELVRDRRDVRGGVDDRTAEMWVGSSIARAVVRDHPHAVVLVQRGIGVSRQATAGSPVADEDRHPVGRAALDERQRPAVPGLCLALALHATDHTDGPAGRTCVRVTSSGRAQPSSMSPLAISSRRSVST